MLDKAIIYITITIAVNFVAFGDSSHSSGSGSSFSKTDESKKSQSSINQFIHCLKEHEFAFVDCFRNVGIITTKNIPEMTKKEFKDFKCALQNSTISCFNMKDDVHCNDVDNPLQNLFTEITPNVNYKCNTTGIIRAQLVEFSI